MKAKQVVVEKPLLDFLLHCEVYCSMACCGMQALEIHKALILSRQGLEDRAKRDGLGQFVLAQKQVQALNKKLQTLVLETINGEVPIWDESEAELPLCWLPKMDVLVLFSKFEEAFFEAAKYNGKASIHKK